MLNKSELHKVYTLFRSCAPLFIALGDEVRQRLILEIADASANSEDGINVKNLSAKTSLSRPAISHHLKVLKDCGLIVPVKEGTQIFYKLNLKENIEEVSSLMAEIQNVLAKISEAESKSGAGKPSSLAAAEEKK